LTFRLTWFLYPSCSHKIAPTKFVIAPLRSCYPVKTLCRYRASPLLIMMDALVLRNALLIDGTGTQPKPDITVVVAGGIIRDIGGPKTKPHNRISLSGRTAIHSLLLHRPLRQSNLRPRSIPPTQNLGQFSGGKSSPATLPPMPRRFSKTRFILNVQGGGLNDGEEHPYGY
jgi:hypothetical protein